MAVCGCTGVYTSAAHVNTTIVYGYMQIIENVLFTLHGLRLVCKRPSSAQSGLSSDLYINPSYPNIFAH